MSKKLLRLLICSCISAQAFLHESPGEEIAQDDWQLSLPGWNYEFPRDHGNHPDFKTEWWYFTGNLKSESGREFGYQLTFFRQGVRPPSDRELVASRFVVNHVQFVHFAISDITKRQFHFAQNLTRGAFGEAGFGQGERLAWIENCEMIILPDGGFRIIGKSDKKSIALDLTPTKPIVFHGDEGVSQKAAGPGRASHYYSFTRLHTKGALVIDDERFSVEGTSWYDHEWATNQLTENQIGWDWFSLHLDDGSELMLFQIRTRDGGRDPFSGGTLIRPDGTTIAVRDTDFNLEPSRQWRSQTTGAVYPVAWRLQIPSQQLDLAIEARLDAQELVLTPISYWEGSIRATGSMKNQPVSVLGYLEMTGYAGPIVGMQATVE